MLGHRLGVPGRARLTVLVILASLLAVSPAHAGFKEWTSGGPPAVSVLSLAIDPLTPRIVYAGTNGDGIFRSPDGGGIWIPINAGLTNPVVFALAINPLDTSVVYAGTDGDGVFRSLNGGATWAPVNNGLTNSVVTSLAITPLQPTILYAGTNGGGVFRSFDGGDNWTAVNNGLTTLNVAALAVNPQTLGIVYAAIPGQGVFRSINAGASWFGFGVTAGLVNTLVTALAIDPVTPTTVYAGTTGGGVFKSPFSGALWETVNTGITNRVITGLAIDPTSPNILYASAPGTGVFRTATGGLGWEALAPQVPNTIVNTLAITPAGACLHAGTTGTGVFDIAFILGACAPPTVVAAVLPSSRSVLVGAPATAFATIINSAPVTAINCGIALLSVVPATLSFQTTDPATNLVTGTPNRRVTISAGGAQTFVLTLTPSAPINSTGVSFNFGCDGTASAPIITGVDTLLLSASDTPVPDIVALAAADDGIVNIPGATGTGAFAVATVNLGSGDTITASADTGGAFLLPVVLSLCETTATGICLAPPAPSVARTINPGDTPTYSVFVTGNAFVPFDPAVNRVFVRFRDPSGQTRGSTSVAVQTQ